MDLFYYLEEKDGVSSSKNFKEIDSEDEEEKYMDNNEILQNDINNSYNDNEDGKIEANIMKKEVCGLSAIRKKFAKIPKYKKNKIYLKYLFEYQQLSIVLDNRIYSTLDTSQSAIFREIIF